MGASQQLATVAALLHQVNRERKAAFEQDSGRLGGFKLSSEFSVSIESGEIQHQATATVGSSGALSVSIDGGAPVDVCSDYVVSSPIIRATFDSVPVMAQFMGETLTGFTIQFHGAVWNVNVLTPHQKAAMAHMPVAPEL